MVQILLCTCLFTPYTVFFESLSHLKMTRRSPEFLSGRTVERNQGWRNGLFNDIPVGREVSKLLFLGD